MMKKYSKTTVILESSAAQKARLCQAVLDYDQGTFLAVEEAPSVMTSVEPDDHIGCVYCIRHNRSWDNEVYEYVGETGLSILERLDLHYNTAFSRKSLSLGVTVGGLHHAMLLEYQANPEGYRSCFTIDTICITKGPLERKSVEEKEVAKLKLRSSNHYNLAAGGGNRPPHLRHGQPIYLTIGDQAFNFPSKTVLWAALDEARCPYLVRYTRTGKAVTTKARSRWLFVEASGGSIAHKLGLEFFVPVKGPITRTPKVETRTPDHIWMHFHPGSARTLRGDLRDELESRAKLADINNKLLTNRISRLRYASGVVTLEEAWKLLLNRPASPLEVEIELPGMIIRSMTIIEWGEYIEKSYIGPKDLVCRADEIGYRLRNLVRSCETPTNDRKLHALGLKIRGRSRRANQVILNTKSPTPRNYVPVSFTDPLTHETKHFESKAAMCREYDVDPVVFHTRRKSGWRTAEALGVVKRKPSLRSQKASREEYNAWLSSLAGSQLKALKSEGYV